MFDILAWAVFGSVLAVMVVLSVGAVWLSREPSSKILLVAVAGGVVSLILTGCAPSAADSGRNILENRVEVGRYGFNNIPGEFLLAVKEGQEVEITFVYGDDDLAENNIHIVSVPDYGITTGTLDRDNPEITVSFIARETGEVAFMCVAPGCTGHHNLHTIHEH